MLTERSVETGFEEFAKGAESKLREALSATLGSERGREATADVLAYAWEHWERVGSMDNPTGYLYVLGRNRGRKASRSRFVTLLPVDPARIPWVEPRLVGYLEGLPARQRTVVVLLYCFEWTMSEVAELLGLSKSTIQRHAERGLSKLRRQMGVEG
jgi:RNA polymerase sigma factor (sigma-70 family)